MIPESFQQIADVIGTGQALVLCNDFGGTEEYIPKKMTEEHKIAVSIGMAAAVKLSGEFGGERLEIPRCVAIHQRKRDAEIREAAAAGKAKKKLAREYQLTERRVRQITNTDPMDLDHEQGNLF